MESGDLVKVTCDTVTGLGVVLDVGEDGLLEVALFTGARKGHRLLLTTAECHIVHGYVHINYERPAVVDYLRYAV